MQAHAYMQARRDGYMPGMRNATIGVISGAAGSMALDVVSYADMALRGRSSSNVPSEVVRHIAERIGLHDLATPDEKADAALKNRRSALGALSGYSVGLIVGLAYGLTRPYTKKLSLPIAAVALGAVAMAASDAPAVRLGATDPRTWGTAGWISDIIPHLAYGLTAALITDALEN